MQLDLILLQRDDVIKTESGEVAAAVNCSGSITDTEDEAVAEQEEESQSFTQTDWLPAVPVSKNTFIATPTYVDDDCFIYLHDTKESKFRVMFYRYGVKMYCNVLCYILVYS
jgi:hypothetical protein